MRIGFHASHELHRTGAPPDYTRPAEAAGSRPVSCSGHFHPWTEREGESGFACA